MESHFLKDFVSGPPGQGRIQEPWYNPDGDCIIYQTSDEAIVADRIDESLTIYRSVEAGKAIGFQIKGVLAIIKRFGLDGMQVEWSEDLEHELQSVSTYALLLAAYDVGPRTIGRRRGYADALESAANHPRIQLDDLDALGLSCPD
jgi:hypothetical protein